MYAVTNPEIEAVIDALHGVTHELCETIHQKQMAVVTGTDAYMTPAAKVETVMQLQRMLERVQRTNYRQIDALAKALV